MRMDSNVAEIRDDLPQIPAAAEFPNALAVMAHVEETLQEAEKAQWAVGDAVLKDIPVQPHGVNDGSYGKLDRLSAVAASLGYGRYTRDHLRKLRQVADRFPEGRRRPDYPWTVHFEAGTPENLDEIIEVAK